MVIKIDNETTSVDIQTQLAEIIDNPMFLEMLGNTQNTIIDMYDVVNKNVFEVES